MYSGGGRICLRGLQIWQASKAATQEGWKLQSLKSPSQLLTQITISIAPQITRNYLLTTRMAIAGAPLHSNSIQTQQANCMHSTSHINSINYEIDVM